MARQFVLTARLNLLPPSNLNAVFRSIQSKLNSLQIPAGLGTGLIRTLNSIGSATNQLTVATAKATAGVQALQAAKAKLNTTGLTTIRVQNQAAASLDNFTRASVAGYRTLPLLTAKVAGYLAVLKGARDAVDFQAKLANIATVVGTTTEAIQPFGRELQALSKELGVSRDNLAGMSEDLLQAGFNTKDVSQLIRSLGKLSLTPSFSDPKRLTETTILLKEVFDEKNLKGYDEALEKINRISIKTSASADQLALGLKRSGATLRGTSHDFNETLALLATAQSATQLGGSTIGVAIKNLATRGSNPEHRQKLKDILGVDTADANGVQKSLVDIVKELAVVKKLFPAGSVKFSEGLTALSGAHQVNVLRALIDNVDDLTTNLEEAGKVGNSVALAVANAQSTLQNQINRTKASFQELFNEIIGDRSLRDFAEAGIQVAQALAEIGKELKPLIPLIAALAASRGLSSLLGMGGGRLAGLGAGLVQTGAYGSFGLNRGAALRLGVGAAAFGAAAGGGYLANQGGNQGVAGETLLGGVGGGLAGSVLGPWGTAIGATTGIIVAFGNAVEHATEQTRTGQLSRATAELEAQVAKGKEADPAERNATFMRELLALREAQRTAGNKGWGGFVLDALKDRANYNMAGHTFFPGATPAGQAANANRRAAEALAKSAPAIEGYLTPEFQKIMEQSGGDMEKFDQGIRDFTDSLGPLASNIIPLIQITADNVRAQGRGAKAANEAANATEKTVDIQKEVSKLTHKMGGAIQSYVQSLDNLTAERLNASNLGTTIRRTNLSFSNLPESERSLASAQLDADAFHASNNILGGGLNAKGLGKQAEGLLGKVFDTQDKLRSLPAEGKTPEENASLDRQRTFLEGTLNILNGQLGQTSNALKNLTDSSAAVAVSFAKLDQLSASQKSRADLATRFVASDAQGRGEIVANNFIAQQAVKAGNLNFSQLNPLQRIEAQQRSLRGLQDLGGTLIDFKDNQGKATKLPANEVITKLLENTKDIAPFIKAPLDEVKARKQAEEEIKKRQDEQLSAQAELVKIQERTFQKAGADMRLLADALNRLNPNAKQNALAGGNNVPLALPAPLPQGGIVPPPARNGAPQGMGVGLFSVPDNMKENNIAFNENVNAFVRSNVFCFSRNWTVGPVGLA